MTTPIAQGPVDVIVGLLFGLKVPVVSSHWKLEFSEAFAGPMFRLCATIYHPTQPPPYNETTWYSKIAAIVVFRRAVLSVRLRRLTPNVQDHRPCAGTEDQQTTRPIAQGPRGSQS